MELIIHLEEPHIHVEVVCDQTGQSQFEFRLLCDVVGAHRNRDVTQLENALGPTLGGVQNAVSSLVRLPAQDGYAELYRKLDVVVADFARDDVRLPIFDQILNLLQCLGRVQHCLCQTQVLVEFDVVLWHH